MRKTILTIILLTSVNDLFGSLRDDLATQMRQEHSNSNISYKVARTWLFGSLHITEDNIVKDVYCNIEYGAKHGIGEMRIPNSAYLNCEHTWPRSKFNKNQSYNQQLTDLHHLYPTQSRANSVRGHLIFSNLESGEIRNCSDSKQSNNAFEPPKQHKGNVARAMFYFAVHYNLNISKKEEKYLRQWNQEDPVDEFEMWRNEEIASIQGNRNIFIDNPELINRIQDF